MLYGLLTPFDHPLVQAYNNGPALHNLRTKCLRAIEVDDACGGNRDTDYYVSMKMVAEGILSELGVTSFASTRTAALDALEGNAYEDEGASHVELPAGKKGIKAAARIKDLEAAVNAAKTKESEQENELIEQDAKLEVYREALEAAGIDYSALESN